MHWPADPTPLVRAATAEQFGRELQALCQELRGRTNQPEGAGRASRYLSVSPATAGPRPFRRTAVLRVGVGHTVAPASGLPRWAVAQLLPIGRVDVAVGAATGDPIGLALVRSRFLPEHEYEVSAKGLDGFSCSARVACRVDRDHPREGSTSPAEVWLAEQAVRAMIANWHGYPFTFDMGPPTDYLTVPRRLAVDGQPLTVPPWTERWPYERAPGQREARSHPVPKPVSMGDVVLVASPYLEAIGLTVSFGDWAYWGRPPEPGARPLDQLSWRLQPRLPDDHFATWLETPKPLSISRGNQHLNFILDEPEAIAADGTVITLPAPARLLDGYPVVPLEPVAAYFGLDVEVLPDADWSGEAFADWLDAVSPENPPPRRPVEPPAPAVDQALLAKIKAALIGRDKLAENLRLGYLADYTFAEDHLAELKRRQRFPPEIVGEWSLHFEWLFPPGAVRAEATSLAPPLAGLEQWRHWHDAREFNAYPENAPGLLQWIWNPPILAPPPLLIGWERESWGGLFAGVQRFELTDEERGGRPHHRLRLLWDDRPSRYGWEFWLPTEALDSPTAIGRIRPRDRIELEMEDYQRQPNGLSLPTAMTQTEWHSLDRELPAEPSLTVVYRRITAAPGADATLARDLERPLAPLVE